MNENFVALNLYFRGTIPQNLTKSEISWHRSQNSWHFLCHETAFVRHCSLNMSSQLHCTILSSVCYLISILLCTLNICLHMPVYRMYPYRSTENSFGNLMPPYPFLLRSIQTASKWPQNIFSIITILFPIMLCQ